MGHHTVSPWNRLKVSEEARWQNRRRWDGGRWPAVRRGPHRGPRDVARRDPPRPGLLDRIPGTPVVPPPAPVCETRRPSRVALSGPSGRRPARKVPAWLATAAGAFHGATTFRRGRRRVRWRVGARVGRRRPTRAPTRHPTPRNDR